jgi:chromosome segregation protein
MKNLQVRVQETDKARARSGDRDKELQAEIAQLEAQGKQLEALVEKTRADVATNTKKSSSLESRSLQFAQRGAAAREKLRSASENISRKEADVRSVKDKEGQRKRLLTQLEEEVAIMRREQTEGSKRLAELERAMSVLASKLGEKSKEQSELSARRDALSREYDRYLEQERTVSASLSDSRARASSLQAQLEASRQRIEGELSGFPEIPDVDGLLAEYGREEPMKQKTRDEMRAELRVITDSLESFGDVNFAAIQDYKSTKDELDFLKRERTDIAQSVKLINRTIGKIDSEAKRRFVEAFESISGKFGQRFTDLFGGGEARLELVGSDDVLEAGVEIIAQPRGKRQMSVGLLSGGEKALVGIALTFALFEHRPAPVCILDEIDAALDEANTARFIERLRHYSQSTQFVIITHNRRTMEIADLIYGVTMENKGVSKLLKLRMEDLAASDAKAKTAASGGQAYCRPEGAQRG